MVVIETASFILAILLLHSLLGKFGVLRAFFDDKVHAIALRELTAINKRADLVAHFGPHDDRYRFAVTPRQILAARPWWRWIFGNMVLEAGLIYGLLSVVFGNIAPNIVLVGVAACYYALAHFLIIRHFKAVRPEVEDEIAQGEIMRRQRFDRLAKESWERQHKS